MSSDIPGKRQAFKVSPQIHVEVDPDFAAAIADFILSPDHDHCRCANPAVIAFANQLRNAVGD